VKRSTADIPEADNNTGRRERLVEKAPAVEKGVMKGGGSVLRGNGERRKGEE